MPRPAQKRTRVAAAARAGARADEPEGAPCVTRLLVRPLSPTPVSTPTSKHAAAAGTRPPASLPRAPGLGRHRAGTPPTAGGRGPLHTATGSTTGPAAAALLTASAAALAGVVLLSSPTLPKLLHGDAAPQAGGAVAAPLAPSFVQPSRDARQPITLSEMVVPTAARASGALQPATAAAGRRTGGTRATPPAGLPAGSTPSSPRMPPPRLVDTPPPGTAPDPQGPPRVPSAPGPVSTPFRPPTLPPTGVPGGRPTPPVVPPVGLPGGLPTPPTIPPTHDPGGVPGPIRTTPPPGAGTGAGISALARAGVVAAKSSGARVGTVVSDAVTAATGARTPEPDPSNSPAVIAPRTVTHTATAGPSVPSARGRTTVPEPQITGVVPTPTPPLP